MRFTEGNQTLANHLRIKYEDTGLPPVPDKYRKNPQDHAGHDQSDNIGYTKTASHRVHSTHTRINWRAFPSSS